MKLNNLDKIELTRKFSALAKDISPCGNQRKIGMITDDTKHGSNEKVHVMATTVQIATV